MSSGAGEISPNGSKRRSAWLGWNFAAAVLLSAFLLFQVQPLISKFILPWFGGSPAVWTTCMLFFQVTLFAGYAYAHFSQRMLSPRMQGVVHAALLALALLLLPIAPSPSWKPLDSQAPTTRILALLAVCVGAPYFALSATGPLLQAWFARACPGHSPYRLYALSNVGSLAALLTYPVVFEPAFDLSQQARMWSGAFLAFAILCGLAALWAARAAEQPAPAEGDAIAGLTPAPAATTASDAPPAFGRRALWLLLPAVASLLLLATMNHVCEDVPPMPFLWVAPLSLYLITFIIAFDHERWYSPAVFSVLAVLTVVAASGVFSALAEHLHQATLGVERLDELYEAWDAFELNYAGQLALFFAAMFFSCMVCHGELVRSRPSPRYLTEFYMLISAGGAVGGIFVSLVAPAIFRDYFEWKIALAVCFVVAAMVAARALGQSIFGRRKPPVYRTRWMLAAIGLVGLGLLACWRVSPQRDQSMLAQARNFYGVVSVEDRSLDAARFHAAESQARADQKQRSADADEPTDAAPPAGAAKPKELFYRQLRNGRVVHGRQFLDPPRSRWPISYYAPFTGVGKAIGYFRNRPESAGNLRVGVVGLGVGTIAAYGRPGSYFRFYEINPHVLAMANEYFSYLRDCLGKHDVELGDARLTLEQDAPQGFHVLVLDAFSGDSIPTHLLTREAVAVYLRHLTPDGVLAIHITNSYIDLAPVVAALADHYHLGSTRTITEDDYARLVFRTDWVMLTRNQAFLAANPPRPPNQSPVRKIRMWTDNYSNLFEILK